MNRRLWITLGILASLRLVSSCAQNKILRAQASSTRHRLTTIDLARLLGSETDSSLTQALNEGLAAITPKQPVDADKALFSNYQISQSTWSKRWTAKLDFTGVAWNTPQAGVLVTDQHVVMAKHYQHARGATLIFHDRQGKPVMRTIIARRADDASDMALGLLNQPVPDSIAVYPVLQPNTNWHKMLQHTWLLITANDRKALVYPIRAVPFANNPAKPELLMAAFDSARSLSKVFEEKLISGDSGHPSFLVAKGKLILMSVSSQGGHAMTGPFFGGAVNQAWLTRAIKQLGGRTRR